MLNGRADQSLAIGGDPHVAGHWPCVAQLRGQVEVLPVPAGGEDEAGPRPVQHLREAAASSCSPTGQWRAVRW